MLGIYRKIDYYRKLRGLPKMEFYKLIQMSDVGYSAMVKNHTVKLTTLEKIANVLNISIFELLHEEPTQSQTPTQKEWQMPPPLFPENTDYIMQLDIPDSDKIVMLREKISLLSLQLQISSNLAETRKERIEKLEIQLASLTK
jgi:DNA-binding Xre family transcriptional regulator